MLITKVENIKVEGYTFDFGIYARDSRAKGVNIRVIKADGKELTSNRVKRCKSILKARLAINELTLEQIMESGVKLRQKQSKSTGIIRSKEYVMVKVQYYALEKFIGKWIRIDTSYLLNRLKRRVGNSDISHRIVPTVKRHVKIHKHQYIIAVKQGLLIADEEPQQTMRLKKGKSNSLKRLSRDMSISHMNKSFID